jgi:GNAT superfamily N-acetyltransferase
MFTALTTDINDLSSTFTRFVGQCRNPRHSWDAQVSVMESDDHVVVIDLQVDKTFKRRLTIMQIEVAPSFQRQGLGRACVRALKDASVAVGRAAHVQSVVSQIMVKLLLSEDFYPVDGGHCFAWEPLSVHTWALDTSQFQNSFYMHDKTIEESALELVETWKKCIPGMELFSTRAKWFEPETDLKKIAAELGIPEIALKDFRKDKACFGISSFFTEVYPEYYVIEGLAVDPQLGPIALEHACLCRITKGKVYAFDLVRRSQLFMYGVVVRPDMKKRMNDVCKDTWAGYSIIQGLNYIKSDESFWD